MITNQEMGLLLGIWLTLFIATLIVTARRRSTVGLIASFLLNFCANHWIASTLYIIPGTPVYNPVVVSAGLEQSVIGMLGFAFGTIVLVPLAKKVLPKERPTLPDQYIEPRKLIWIFLVVGLVSYALPRLTPLLSELASIDTFANALSQCILLAACLFLYTKSSSGSRTTFISMLVIALCFPIISLVFDGFLSFGTVASVATMTFYFAFRRFRAKQALLTLVVAYIGLSILANYLNHRETIRSSVWAGDPILSRVEVVMNTLAEFEWLTWDSSSFLLQIDSRMNRNYMVGQAVYQLRSGFVAYANGSTFLDTLIAPIPRILWPEKPNIAGGNKLATQFTGEEYDPNTTIGSGPVFEGYVNFGSVGVLMLFTIWALVIGICDTQARHAIERGNFRRFSLWFLPGFTLVSTADSVASITGAMISLVIAVQILYFAIKLFSKPENKAVTGTIHVASGQEVVSRHEALIPQVQQSSKY
ncbi:MAG TPA: hypothetical protein VEX13_15805 [Chloroflexia bacterium]|nr:hypothetical protein [Chloroflexia bacterium]